MGRWAAVIRVSLNNPAFPFPLEWEVNPGCQLLISSFAFHHKVPAIIYGYINWIWSPCTWWGLAHAPIWDLAVERRNGRPSSLSWAVTFSDIACASRKPHSSNVTTLPKYTSLPDLKKLWIVLLSYARLVRSCSCGSGNEHYVEWMQLF